MITLNSKLPPSLYVQLCAHTLRDLISRYLLSVNIVQYDDSFICTEKNPYIWELNFSISIPGENPTRYRFELIVNEKDNSVYVDAHRKTQGIGVGMGLDETISLSGFKEQFDLDSYFSFFQEHIDAYLTNK